MITHGSRTCYGCGGRGTRQVLIDGRPTWLCGDCPTPAEIRRRRDAIKLAWSAEEEAKHRFGGPGEHALDRLAWQPPLCTVAEGGDE